MVAFHQCLESALDLLQGGVGLEPERVERTALGVAHGADLPPLAVRACTGWAAELAKHAERIAGELGTEARGIRARRRAATIHAHFPGRPMAYHRFALI